MRGSTDFSLCTIQILFLLREIHQRQRFSMERWSPRQPLPSVYQKSGLSGRKQMLDTNWHHLYKQHRIPLLSDYCILSSGLFSTKISHKARVSPDSFLIQKSLTPSGLSAQTCPVETPPEEKGPPYRHLSSPSGTENTGYTTTKLSSSPYPG